MECNGRTCKRILDMLYQNSEIICVFPQITQKELHLLIKQEVKQKMGTVDTLLIKLYAYFKYNDIQYLKNIFTQTKENSQKKQKFG